MDMKLFSTLFLTLFLLSSQAAAQYQFASNSEAPVTIYYHAQFQGDQHPIYEDWSIRHSDEYWNDQISSIRVEPGYVVEIFEHANFTGRKRILRGDWSVYAWNDPWNDRVSSIRVRRIGQNQGDCGARDRVEVFQHTGFSGARFALDRDWSIRCATDAWNDQISSIRVPRGWTVELYADANFRGDRMVLHEDWSTDWRDYWNDRISSIRVYRNF